MADVTGNLPGPELQRKLWLRALALIKLSYHLSFFIVPVVAILAVIFLLPWFVSSYLRWIRSLGLSLEGWLLCSVLVFVILLVAQLAYSIYKRHVIEVRYSNRKTKYFEIDATLKSLDYAAAKYNTIGTISAQVVCVAVLIFGAVVFHLFDSTQEYIGKALSTSPSSSAATAASNNLERSLTNKETSKAAPTTATHQESKDRGWLIMVIILMRTSLLGSLIVAFIIKSFNFVSSSFDQAVRFKKRKHATLFLLQLLEDTSLTNNLPSIMNAFKEWNTNVESAYTSVKAAGKEPPIKTPGITEVPSVTPGLTPKGD